MTSTDTRAVRTESYGADGVPWMVRVRDALILNGLLKHGRPYANRRVADIGCGFHATTGRRWIDEVESLVLVDVAVDPGLASEKVRIVEGALPEVLTALPDESLDVIVCSAVLEHLWDPEACIAQLHRVLAPGGVLLVAVPSWLGKTVLEFLAFKLKLSADEMDDHKRYFDPRDLWPMLVDAGFRPRLVRCRRHWMRMNTFAVCRREEAVPLG